MVRPPLRLFLGAAAAVAAAGCGGVRASLLPARSPYPTFTEMPASSGEVLGSASNAAGWMAVVTAQPGGQLQLAVTVTGPLTVVGGCVPSLTALAETTAGMPVPTPTPTAGVQCLAIALEAVPAGTTRSFSASLPEPPPARDVRDPGVPARRGLRLPGRPGGDHHHVTAVRASRTGSA